MINEKTQLGKVVSLLEGFECHFHAEYEKSIFGFNKSRVQGVYTGKCRKDQLLRLKIDFSYSAWKWHSNPSRCETTLPSCVFLFIIVGVKRWLILKKSIFSNFFRFQDLLKRAKNGRSASDDLVANGEKITKTWFYHLQTLGSCRGSSQLSANIFWRSRGCLKLLKLNFFKKKFKKVADTEIPPPV